MEGDWVKGGNHLKEEEESKAADKKGLKETSPGKSMRV